MDYAESQRQQYEGIQQEHQKSDRRFRPNWDRHDQAERDKRDEDSRLLVELCYSVLQVEGESIALNRLRGLPARVGIQFV
jgi:hypothetical protein